jgi:hypothetical protein
MLLDVSRRSLFNYSFFRCRWKEEWWWWKATAAGRTVTMARTVVVAGGGRRQSTNVAAGGGGGGVCRRGGESGAPCEEERRRREQQGEEVVGWGRHCFIQVSLFPLSLSLSLSGFDLVGGGRKSHATFFFSLFFVRLVFSGF